MSFGPGVLPFELDNTPYGRYENGKQGAGFGWCDPFGAETSMRVLGGTSDPKRERHAWVCKNRADGRYRFTCRNGHTGEMSLCYGHVASIRGRMSDFCPRCAFPPRARELQERSDYLQRQMFAPGVRPEERRRLYGALEDVARELTEMMQRGQITRGGPLRLEEIS